MSEKRARAVVLLGGAGQSAEPRAPYCYACAGEACERDGRISDRRRCSGVERRRDELGCGRAARTEYRAEVRARAAGPQQPLFRVASRAALPARLIEPAAGAGTALKALRKMFLFGRHHGGG